MKPFACRTTNAKNRFPPLRRGGKKRLWARVRHSRNRMSRRRRAARYMSSVRQVFPTVTGNRGARSSATQTGLTESGAFVSDEGGRLVAGRSRTTPKGRGTAPAVTPAAEFHRDCDTLLKAWKLKDSE